MSRSGYTEDGEDTWDYIRWRGAVNSAIKGQRGQAFLRELLAALDAMPEKSLAPGALESDGEFCALGVIGHARGLDLSSIDTENWPQLSRAFNIAESMAREIMWENDDSVDSWDYVEIHGPLRPREYRRSERVWNAFAGLRRWRRMREWVAGNIIQPASQQQGSK